MSGLQPGELSPTAQYVLDWKPPVLRLPDTLPAKNHPHGTRGPSFYDKHLGPDMQLRHVQHFPELKKDLMERVDTALVDLRDRGIVLPFRRGLQDPDYHELYVRRADKEIVKEIGVPEFYKTCIADLCTPVASTIALHPTSHAWNSMFAWTSATSASGFAISDGSMKIRAAPDPRVDSDADIIEYTELLDAMARHDPEAAQIIPIIREAAVRAHRDIAVWEFKSLSVGTQEVMDGIRNHANSRRPFRWQTCTESPDVCAVTHRQDIDDVDRARIGVDAESVWNLPQEESQVTRSSFIASQDVAGSYENDPDPLEPDHPLPDELTNAHAVEGRTATVRFGHASAGSIADGRSVAASNPSSILRQRAEHMTILSRSDELDDREEGSSRTLRRNPPRKRRKSAPSSVPPDIDETDKKGKGKARALTSLSTGSTRFKYPKRDRPLDRDDSFEAPKQPKAEDLLQQAWAQAVRSNATVVVISSGNLEYVCIRHRASQTLFISELIEPPNCAQYGKLQVGLYIGAIQDAIARYKLNKIVEEATKKPSPPHDPDDKGEGGSGGDRGGGGNGDKPRHDDDQDDGNPTPGAKRRKTEKSPQRGKKKGSSTRGSKPKKASGIRRMTRGAITREKQEMDRSIVQASVRHVLCLSLCYGIYNSPIAAIFIRDTPSFIPPDVKPIDPLSPRNSKAMMGGNSLAIVLTSELGYGGTGIVHGGRMSLPGAEGYAEVKVAVKLALAEEHQLDLRYECAIYQHLNSKGVKGVPVVLGYFIDKSDDAAVLVMTYAGKSIIDRTQVINSSHHESFLKILRTIHEAGVLHGDLSLSNLLVNDVGDTFIVDFHCAQRSWSRSAQAEEISHLQRILGGRE